VVCFPECFVPGYRWPGTNPPPPDPAFLEGALAAVSMAAKQAEITVVLGTEKLTNQGLQIAVCVFNPDGAVAGWQEKGQIDPTEESTYPAFGDRRAVFTAGPLTFGVAICHEGWRYPETVRWAARRGAQVVFHPHFDLAEPGTSLPTVFADPSGSFHEKAILCRAAENTCYFASVNCGGDRAAITTAIASPDGRLLCHQPYGQAGLLIADLDLGLATGLLAARCRTSPL
jgi:predicted amidohydrolase